MKPFPQIVFIGLLFGCSQSDNKTTEQKTIQNNPLQDTTYHFIKRILNASPTEVETILGRPDKKIQKSEDCGTELPSCDEAYYRNGSLEALFYNNKLKWLSVNQPNNIQYNNDVAERLDFPAAIPYFASDATIRWENYEGIKQISVFPKGDNPKEVDYILILVETGYDKMFEATDAKSMENAHAENQKQEKIGAEQFAQHKAIVEAQFSSLDGSHINLTKEIKKGMNDPSSYEHMSTKYFDLGDHIKVITEFGGTNAFGVKVKNTVIAQVGLDGQIIEMETVK